MNDPLTREPPLEEGEVIEVPLLLPGWQMSALERVAHKHGLTAGEMVRHVLRDFFAEMATHPRKPMRGS